MRRTPMNPGFSENVTASHSDDGSRHISGVESDALIARLKEAIGGNVSAFARRSHVRESLLRKYLAGSQPGVFNIVQIAEAAGVTTEWLATGRAPKTRGELRDAMRAQGREGEDGRCASPPGGAADPVGAPRINAEALAAILTGILQAMGPAPDYPRAVRKAVEYYLDALREGLITADGAEAPHADGA